MEFVLGIDGGGTSCRAALASAAGVVLGRGKSGSANIRTDLSGARASIVEAARLAFVDAGEDPELIAKTPALLGLAGSNVGPYRDRLEAILPFRESAIESDGMIALEGALGGHDGAIAVFGTGSVYMGRRTGVVRRIGGWGFLIGDQGGGARIGRAVLEEILLVHDGLRPGSPFASALLARFAGDPREVVEYTTEARPADFGTFAPMVFEAAENGDSVASRILDRAVADIAEALDALALEGDERLCLLGGLAPLLGPRLPPAHRARIEQPLQDALGGAVTMALARFAASMARADG